MNSSSTVTIFDNSNYTSDISNIDESLGNATNRSVTQEFTGVSLISENEYSQFRDIAFRIIVPIICLIGITGNSLGLVVLYKTARQRPSSIYRYILALTASDTLYLVTGVLRCVEDITAHFDPSLANFYGVHMRRVITPLDITLTCISSYLICCISIERFYAVWRPLKVRNTVWGRRPAFVVLLVVAIAVLTSLPVVMMFEIVKTHKPDTNETVYLLEIHPTFLTNDILKKISLLGMTVIQFYIPFATILPLNVAILIKFAKVKKQRDNLTAGYAPDSLSPQQVKVTSVIITLTLMYIMFTLPGLAIQTLAFIDEDFDLNGKHAIIFWLLSDIGNILLYLNAAADFVVYIVRSSTLADTFKNMYSCNCQKVSGTDLEFEDTHASFATTTSTPETNADVRF